MFSGLKKDSSVPITKLNPHEYLEALKQRAALEDYLNSDFINELREEISSSPEDYKEAWEYCLDQIKSHSDKLLFLSKIGVLGTAITLIEELAQYVRLVSVNWKATFPELSEEHRILLFQMENFFKHVLSNERVHITTHPTSLKLMDNTPCFDPTLLSIYLHGMPLETKKHYAWRTKKLDFDLLSRLVENHFHNIDWGKACKLWTDKEVFTLLLDKAPTFSIELSTDDYTSFENGCFSNIYIRNLFYSISGKQVEKYYHDAFQKLPLMTLFRLFITAEVKSFTNGYTTRTFIEGVAAILMQKFENDYQNSLQRFGAYALGLFYLNRITIYSSKRDSWISNRCITAADFTQYLVAISGNRITSFKDQLTSLRNCLPKITTPAESDRILTAVIAHFKTLEVIKGTPAVIDHICFLETQFTALHDYYETKSNSKASANTSPYLPLCHFEQKIAALRMTITSFTNEYLQDEQACDLLKALQGTTPTATLLDSSENHDVIKSPSAPKAEMPVTTAVATPYGNMSLIAAATVSVETPLAAASVVPSLPEPPRHLVTRSYASVPENKKEETPTGFKNASLV